MNVARILSWLQLMRFPAVFTAISNVVAAQLIVTHGNPHAATLLFVLGASCCIYLAGMVLNDCFDMEEDRRDRPQRPLPSGRIALAAAWRLGWGLLLAGVALAAMAGTRPLAVACLLALAVVLYDGFLKRTAFGSVAMGTCRYLNWMLGLSVVPLQGAVLLLGIPILLYVISLTHLSREEARAANRGALLSCAVGIVLTGAVIVALYWAAVLPHRWALLLVALGFAAVLNGLVRTARTFSPESIQAMVKFLLLGVIPLDALLVFAGGPWWGGLLVLSLLIPGKRLARRIYVT